MAPGTKIFSHNCSRSATYQYLHVLCNDHINEKHHHTQPVVKDGPYREALGVDSVAASHSDDKYFETFGLVGGQAIAT
jgi:hypothetical protein